MAHKLDWYSECADHDFADIYDDGKHDSVGVCPRCTNGNIVCTGSENYGTDRDGKRGVVMEYYGCTNPDCDYEEENI